MRSETTRPPTRKHLPKIAWSALRQGSSFLSRSCFATLLLYVAWHLCCSFSAACWTSITSVCSNFSRGAESTILLILFRLLTMQRKRTSTKRFTLFTPQTKFPCYGNSCKKCASLPAIVLFTHVFSRRIKLRGMWLTAISSHGLATIPATDVCIHHYMRQNAYCVLS